MIVIRERFPGGPLVTNSPLDSMVRGGLTLILPSHNEAPSLGGVVRQWWDQRPPGVDLEILVVDDAEHIRRVRRADDGHPNALVSVVALVGHRHDVAVMIR